MEVVIQPDAHGASIFVAELIAADLRKNPRLVLGLATGRTMGHVYARLVEIHRSTGLDFWHCRTFNLDEYVGLAGDDPHSYRHYMDQHLFTHVNIERSNTHLPDGAAKDVEGESARYEALIKQCGGIDLQLLGIGMNGHLGFNEPDSPFDSRTRPVELAAETLKQNAGLFKHPAHMPKRAITMGLGTIFDSRRCVLLATGKDKAEIVRQAIQGPVSTAMPATILQRHGNCTVVLDHAAAGAL